VKSANALAVMLKAPVAGLVKTRMVPPLTHEQAARLYECLAMDTFSSLGSLRNIDIYAAYLGPVDTVKDMVPDGVGIFPQTGSGLGERMFNTLSHLLEMGYKRCGVIGSDLPDLPARFIEEAFAALEGGAQLVLGPAADGGYYLAAVDGPYELVFTSISYSTPSVLKETLARAAEGGIRYALASPWQDIDDAGDLALLEANPSAPESSRFIEGLLS